MGNFYTNVTLKGPGQDQVAAYLAGRTRGAYVSPTEKECTVVFDELGDSQDTEELARITGELSRQFACPALVVLNHDDDVLWYQLYVEGELCDEYNSWPDYFGFGADESADRGGNPAKLCDAFGVGNAVLPVARVLSSDDYLFALERHEALVQALGLPEWTVAVGYNYIANGEVPPGLDGDALVKTG